MIKPTYKEHLPTEQRKINRIMLKLMNYDDFINELIPHLLLPEVTEHLRQSVIHTRAALTAIRKHHE